MASLGVGVPETARETPDLADEAAPRDQLEFSFMAFDPPIGAALPAAVDPLMGVYVPTHDRRH